MTRKTRFLPVGIPQHVIQRGNDRFPGQLEALCGRRLKQGVKGQPKRNVFLFHFARIKQRELKVFELRKNKTVKACLVCAVFSLVTGCASSYQYDKSSNSASLLIIGNTENFFVDNFKNEACDVSVNGTRVVSFSGPRKDVETHIEGKEILIPAGETFITTAHYIDAQFALNRSCSKMVAFTPVASARYVASFNVNDDVTDCDYVVGLITEENELVEEITAYYPQDLCLMGENAGPKNGKAGRVVWEAEFFRYGLPDLHITTKQYDL